MAIDRSKFVTPNVRANLKVTQSDKLFINVKEDSTSRVRFLPTTDGIIFRPTCNHFKLKMAGDEGGQARGVALACLWTHGDGGAGSPCYLCDLVDVLKKSSDKAEAKIGKDLAANIRFNAQVLQAERDPSTSKWSYDGPKILGLPKGAADDVNKLLARMESMDQPLFTDIEQGQDLLISRTGSGFATRYTVDRLGQTASLDEIFPDWSDKYLEDMDEALGLRILPYEEQKAVAVFTYGDALDWEEIDEQIG